MGNLNDDKDRSGDAAASTEQEDKNKTSPAGDGQDTQQGTETETGSSDSSSNQDTGGDDELVRLRKQLKTVNDESAGRRHAINELEDKIKKLERKDMDEKQRLEAELADLKGADEERTSLKEKVEALETAVSAQVEALTKSLKVPAYVTELLEGMTPAKQLEYLSTNSKHFLKETTSKPDIDAGAKGKNPGKTKENPEERRKKLGKRIPALNRRRR